MGLIMACMGIPIASKVWTQQVNLDLKVRNAILTPTHLVKIIHSVVILQESGTGDITAAGCSGDSIQIGQLVQLLSALLTNFTLSLTTIENAKLLDWSTLV